MEARGEPVDAPSRLARRVGLADAVVLGLGSMVGAGVFAAWGPAAAAGGSGLLAGLGVAAAVAYCNADSSARLAALYPESGGTYAYGRHRLGAFWGWLAGWAFVAGKLASCAAMALTFGAYAAPAPAHARPLAVAAVVAATGVNLLGVGKTVGATRAIVAVVVAVLLAFVAATLVDGAGGGGGVGSPVEGGALGILRSAGLLFFAFAGYARIATLGEEVREPRRTIPRAIPLALGLAVALYAGVGLAALAAAGPERLAGAAAPLREAAPSIGPLVAAGAAVASLGVLLSLLAGISRTVFAMASNGDLPRALAGVHPRRRVPHRAEAAIGLVVAAAVAAGLDLGAAIGFSSFCVLVYYAVANASALTLGGRVAVPVAGLVGCLALAATLPPRAAAVGAGVLAAGALGYAVRRRAT